MRFKKCIKFLLFSITLAICSVFFSNDTNAAVVDLSGFELINSYTSSEMQGCFVVNCSTWGASTFNVKLTQSDLYSIRTTNTFTEKKGDLIEFLVEVRSDYDPSQNTSQSLVQLGILQGPATRLLQYSELYDSSVGWLSRSNSIAISPSTNSSDYSTTYNENGYLYKVIQVLQYVNSDGTRPIQVGSGSSYSFRVKPFPLGNPNATYDYNFRILSMNQYRRLNGAEEMNNKDDEDRDNLEAQSSQTDSDSSSSAEDASDQGTTLLGAFTAFVNALTNASPSNCRLLMNIGRFEAGQVDLCTLDPPAGFSAIASIFLILFCVPLSIATARKVISLFRSFQ